MNRDEIRAALIFMAVGMLCGLIIGYGAGVTKSRRDYAGSVVKSDTVIRWETTIVHEPQARDTLVLYTERVKVPVSKDQNTASQQPVFVTNELHDTIYNTIVERDSIYVDLPITQKVYRDTAYTAWVSGFNPQLDSISLYRPITTITNTITPRPKRFGLGVQVGYGVTPQGKFFPYLGVGFSYNILRF